MAASHLASPFWHVVAALAVAGALALHGGPARADPAETLRFGDGSETYRGYHIEMARDVPNAEIGRLRQAAEHQVDLVEATHLDPASRTSCAASRWCNRDPTRAATTAAATA